MPLKEYTIGFIGYLVAGFPCASVATLATFLPCWLFIILPVPYFSKNCKNHTVKAFVDGITAAIVGALARSVIVIASRIITDITTAVIANATIFALIYIKKLQKPYIIGIAAILGLLIKSFI